MQLNYKPIGNYIQPVDKRNTVLQDFPLMGLSISKEFISSVANIIGTDLSNYKMIKNKQFACSLMQVSRDGKMPVAMYCGEAAIMSPAYPMFEVKNENELLPEYLMMWFSREEFDRQAAYYAVGGVRGNLPWEDFCEMTFPLPPIAHQRALVAEYNAVQNRIKLSQQLIQTLEQTAQAIYKKYFVEEVDESWEKVKLGEVSDIKAGGDKPKTFSETKTEKCFVPIYSNGVTNDGLYGFTDKANYSKNSITISARGTIGFSVLRRENFDAIVRLLVLIPKIKNSAIYLWQTIKGIEFDNSGSVQNQLTVPQVSVVEIVIPEQEILDKYNSISEIIFNEINLKNQETQKLQELQSLLLAKMASIENNRVFTGRNTNAVTI